VPTLEIGTMTLACRRDRRTVPIIASLIDHVLALDLTFPPPS
jgi:hypothetical protein